MKSLIRPLAFLIISAVAFATIPPPQPTLAAVASDWNRKVEIIIQSSKVDAGLTDFPVLLTEDTVPSEACDADGMYPAQNGGGDIRFTSDENGNSQLPLEIVTFVPSNDPADCEVEMYVKVPTVSSSTDTSIWMWYNTDTTDDQPAADSTYGSENVWTNGYVSVWHLEESGNGSAGEFVDSTSNDNDGQGGGGTAGETPTQTGAVIGHGQSIDNTDDWIRVADSSSFNVGSAITASAWVKGPSQDTADDNAIVGQYDTGANQRAWILEAGKNYPAKLTVIISDDGTFDDHAKRYITNATVFDNTWTHLAFTFDGSDLDLFIDGVSAAVTKDIDPTISTIHNSTAPVTIGAHVTSGSEYRFFDGEIDEVRLSNTVRSAAWLDAEYENQNDPAAFAIEQTPQEASTAPEETVIRKSSDESVTNSTTLQNDDHFVFTLKANTEYVLNAGLFATSSTAGPDIKIGFALPTGAIMDIGYLAQGGSNRRAELLETPGGGSSNIPIPGGQNTIIQAFGTFITGSTGGTLNFQWAQNSANATATTVKQGSFIAVTEVSE